MGGPKPEKPIKVFWICHFSNREIQQYLRPRRNVHQFAPWITYTIPVFETSTVMELHVISPHEYIVGPKEFTLRNVHYHFFNPGIPLWGRHWPHVFRWDRITDYAYNKSYVRKLVNRIKPNIIHLQGAENLYYSITALQFLDLLPMVVNIQRINLSVFGDKNQPDPRRIEVETQILREFQHFSVRTNQMRKDLLYFHPGADVHMVNYAMPDLVPIFSDKVYDIVYFASISQAKGIEDLLQALVMVKAAYSAVRLCVIGSGNQRYIENLKTQCEKHGLSSNVFWAGHLPDLDRVHAEASKARISVLPTHNDIISGTIIESMQLGLPVVSYKIGSIPELNLERENVLIVEKGDIHGLAANIIRLLTDPDLYNTMSRRGIEHIKHRYGNQDVHKQHLDCYKQIIQDFTRRKLARESNGETHK